jgi:hypothetical protein
MAHGGRPHRSRVLGVLRMRWAPTPPLLSCVRLRTHREASVLCDPEKNRAVRTPRCLRAFASFWRDGAFYGCGRSDHGPSLRNLCGALACSRPQARSSCGDGQSRGAPAQEGKGGDRGERLCELIYLPPYSPDLNPIKEALSKVKYILRKIGARTKEALIEAMSLALAAVSTEDARGFFAHCGYRIPAQ